MFCPHCGKQSEEGHAFCAYCGGKLPLAAAAPDPVPVAVPVVTVTPTQQQTLMDPVLNVEFGEAIKSFYNKYADFHGRATRKEYWYAMLYYNLFTLGMYLIDTIAFGSISPFALGMGLSLYGMYAIIDLLFIAAHIVPCLAVAWRRMHDVGKSGAYYLLGLIPIVGWILVLIPLCTISEGDNVYGPRKTAPVKEKV